MADSDPSSTSPTAAAPAQPATLGEMLRTARLAQDLTLEQLSTELRIEAKQLNALEENRFEQIGVPVFVKGYLKQYGQRLGIDVRDLLAVYYKQTTLADVQIQPSRSIKLRDERQITSWVLAALVLLLVIVGLAVWWWNGGDLSGLSLTRSPSATTTPAVAEPVTRPAPRSIEPAAAPARAPAPEAADEAQAEPPAAAADDPAAEALPPEFVAPADDADADGAEPVAAVPLEFVFDEESWTEVTDARGERLAFGLNAAGQRLTLSGEPPFAVVLGNSDAVRLTVAGAPYPIPPTRREDGLVRFSVYFDEE
jgi:cytoskeleton protein RodZ